MGGGEGGGSLDELYDVRLSVAKVTCTCMMKLCAITLDVIQPLNKHFHLKYKQRYLLINLLD